MKNYISCTAKAERILQGYGNQDFFSGVKPLPVFIENLLNLRELEV